MDPEAPPLLGPTAGGIGGRWDRRQVGQTAGGTEWDRRQVGQTAGGTDGRWDRRQVEESAGGIDSKVAAEGEGQGDGEVRYQAPQCTLLDLLQRCNPVCGQLYDGGTQMDWKAPQVGRQGVCGEGGVLKIP